MDGRSTTLAPKQAIAVAKAAIADLFDEEPISSIRLEEIRFENAPDRWLVTVGFDRPSASSERHKFLDMLSQSRNFKIVSIKDETGEVLSVTNWKAS